MRSALRILFCFHKQRIILMINGNLNQITVICCAVFKTVIKFQLIFYGILFITILSTSILSIIIPCIHVRFCFRKIDNFSITAIAFIIIIPFRNRCENLHRTAWKHMPVSTFIFRIQFILDSGSVIWLFSLCWILSLCRFSCIITEKIHILYLFTGKLCRLLCTLICRFCRKRILRHILHILYRCFP